MKIDNVADLIAETLAQAGDLRGLFEAILKAEGQKQSAILAAQGQAEAIGTVFKAIHEGNPDPQLLAYLNRLSDLLFVAARYVASGEGGDVLWQPGASRDG